MNRRDVLQPDLLICADGTEWDLRWVWRNGKWEPRLSDRDVKGADRVGFWEAKVEQSVGEEMRRIGDAMMEAARMGIKYGGRRT